MEFEAAGEIEGGQLEIEELLPEGEVLRLNQDELVEHLPRFAVDDLAQGLVERQIEQLVQDELPGQSGVMLLRHGLILAEFD